MDRVEEAEQQCHEKSCLRLIKAPSMLSGLDRDGSATCSAVEITGCEYYGSQSPFLTHLNLKRAYLFHLSREECTK